MPDAAVDVTPAAAVAFRVAAHGLDRRSSERSSLASAARVALPDYPRGAALRSLAARRAGVAADALDRALGRGSLVRAYSLRGTTHVVAGSDAATWATGVLPTPGDEDATRAALGSSWPTFEALGVGAVDALDRVADEIGRVAADGRPRSKGAISEALHDRLPDGWEPWCPRCRSHHVPDLLFRLAVVSAGLRFPDAGTGMVTGPRPGPADHAAARAELVRRFLGAHAPAPSRAFAEWCGLGPAEAEASFATLGDEVVAVRLDGRRGARALAADVARLTDPAAAAADGVRLVPAGDPFLHQRDRATLLPDPEHRQRLWRPAGAPGLVLVGGAPAGVWRHKQGKAGVDVTVELWATAPVADDLAPDWQTEAATVLALSPNDAGNVDVEVTAVGVR